MNPDDELKALFDERGRYVSVTPGLADRAIARDQVIRRRQFAAAAVAGTLAFAAALALAWPTVRPTASPPIPAGPSSTLVTAPTSAPTSAPTTSSPSVPRPTATSVPTIRATDAVRATSMRFAGGAVTGTTSARYLVDGVFHDGTTTITLPDDLRDTGFVARLGNGLVVSGAQGLVRVEPDGSRGKTIESAQDEPRIASDRTHVLTSDANGTLVYSDFTGTRIATRAPSTTGGGPYRPAGLVGPTAYAAALGTTNTWIAWDVERDTVTTSTGGELTYVSPDGRLGLVYVVARDVKADGSNNCYALVDLATGQPRWRFCGPIRFTGFSADGAYLLGTGHVDGFNPWLFESLVVVDAETGRVVLQGGGLTADAVNQVVGATMTIDQTLTVQVWNGTQRSLQRCRLDGSCEVVGAAKPLPNPGVPEAPGPYLLSAN